MINYLEQYNFDKSAGKLMRDFVDWLSAHGFYYVYVSPSQVQVLFEKDVNTIWTPYNRDIYEYQLIEVGNRVSIKDDLLILKRDPNYRFAMCTDHFVRYTDKPGQAQLSKTEINYIKKDEEALMEFNDKRNCNEHLANVISFLDAIDAHYRLKTKDTIVVYNDDGAGMWIHPNHVDEIDKLLRTKQKIVNFLELPKTNRGIYNKLTETYKGYSTEVTQIEEFDSDGKILDPLRINKGRATTYHSINTSGPIREAFEKCFNDRVLYDEFKKHYIDPAKKQLVDTFEKYFNNTSITNQVVNNLWEKENTNMRPTIKKVIFNNPATIVLWSDGTKTVVKVSEMDTYDPEKGMAMAICKKFAYGNYRRILDIFKTEDPEKALAVAICKRCMGPTNYNQTFERYRPEEDLD